MEDLGLILLLTGAEMEPGLFLGELEKGLRLLRILFRIVGFRSGIKQVRLVLFSILEQRNSMSEDGMDWREILDFALR